MLLHVHINRKFTKRILKSFLLLQEEFEDTKGVVRICLSKNNRQNNDQKEEQTTQWPNENVQKDKQRSTKHTHKAKDRGTRTTLKTGGELRHREGKQFLLH